ncbi:MAG: sensor histidine kinase [Burkholderiaceae bacterium]
MRDSQILSAYHELAPRPRLEETVWVFDACQLGVVLRAVLFVECVVGVGAMFGAHSLLDWVTRLALLTGGALPATLSWLVVACLCKKLLARLTETGQYLAGSVLGALSALLGAALLALVGGVPAMPWVASACTGALLACLLVGALVLRAKGMTPAATAARLSDLQSRIRPHFLFNTLNTAIALVRAEPAKAEAMLEDLSDLFRHALVEPGQSVTLAQETALAQRYLAIEQVRFGARLRIEWSLDPAAGRAKLPPLLLQPLVENAVKHGVEPSAEGADIKITTQRRGNMVVIKVTNTVPGGQGLRGHGLALENVRDRLSLLHDVQGSFHAALKDGLYQVRIEVPA